MSFHVIAGNAPSIEYAGRPMEVLAGLDGSILVVGDGEPTIAGPGSLFVAPRGERHGFSHQSRILP